MKKEKRKKNLRKQPTPLVSIVMPVYNAEKYLTEAIQSIMKQTYQNFELIIIDDKSTDRSSSIIRNFKNKFPKKIQTYVMSKNLNCGGDKCANFGITKARGKYIARMDADDIAVLTRIEKQVEFLEAHKSVFLVGSNAYVINSEGEIIGEKKEPLSPSDIYKSYFTFHPLIHPSCMFRTHIGGKKFQYKIQYNANNDYLTFFSLICKGIIFTNLEDKLLYYRIHEKNDTFVHMKKKFINTIRIRLLMVNKFGYTPSFKDIFINLIQMVIVFPLPERVLKQIYFWAKGIKSYKITIKMVSPRVFKIN